MNHETALRWFWLARVLSPKRFYQVLALYGDFEEVWRAPGLIQALAAPGEYQALIKTRDEAFLYGLFERYGAKGIQVLTHLHADYPDALRFIEEPPTLLYARGDVACLAGHAVGIVGSRTATRDGLRLAHGIARELAENGVTVVSGMARGIDTAAHEGCLAGQGRTAAVLGCGVDVEYPAENKPLLEEIAERGCALSEYPPGTPPLKYHFPRRNRIISGLSSGVLLAEGRDDSGALITMRYAADQGRARFALPGSILSPGSAAPNHLIMEGAVAVENGRQILQHLGWAAKPKAARAALPALDGDGAKVVGALKKGEMSFDELVSATGLTSQALNTILTILSMRGIIEQLPGRICRIDPMKYQL